MSHKSEDYKISAVKYYLDSNKTQEEVCDIFKCSVRSLMRWVERYENEVQDPSTREVTRWEQDEYLLHF